MHSRGTQLNYAYLKTRIIAITLTLLLTLPLLTHTTAIATTQPKVEWEKTYGGADDDVGLGVLETRDGGYIMVGYTRSFGAGGRDVYLIKLGLGTALTTTPEETATATPTQTPTQTLTHTPMQTSTIQPLPTTPSTSTPAVATPKSELIIATVAIVTVAIVAIATSLVIVFRDIKQEHSPIR